jgi:site-specific DNA recombinase
MIYRRCAAYSRKSTDEGLDHAFNSLDAQREACEAYILSQRHEGWQLVKTAYDDGGFSGGSMERPALQALMRDVSAGRIDVIVVYKIDRLTRSLADFAKMVEVFDAKGVSFVSVTQQFNTTTSMGRLTLNVLLSFAQFEREVTAERIRDKILASRKKGMWMGGSPPLGYDIRDKKLMVNATEAATVRQLFEAYLGLASLTALTAWAKSEGITTKIRWAGNGNIRSGGKPFSRGNLHALLGYRTYIGEVIHKGNIYPGEQDAIVSRALWDAVQAKLSEKKTTLRSPGTAADGSLLTGLLFDGTGDRLTPIHANKKGCRYRYYVSRRLLETNVPDPTAWRLPAHQIENVVISTLATFLNNKTELLSIIGDQNLAAVTLNHSLSCALQLAEMIQQSNSQERRNLIVSYVARISVASDQLVIQIRRDRLIQMLEATQTHPTTINPDAVVHKISASLTLRRRGVEAKLIFDNHQHTKVVDPLLVSTIANAHTWFRELVSGQTPSINEIARKRGIPASEVSRLLPLAFLAPDIVEAIADGRQLTELTTKFITRFRDLPLDWDQQRKALGFPTGTTS